MDVSVLLVYHDAMTRTTYPSDGSDEAWAFVALAVTLMDEAAPQWNDPLRDVANGLRSMLRTGAPWRMLPTDVPPWPVVDHQTQRCLTAGVGAQMVHDVRMLLRAITDRAPQPRAVIVASRTLQSTPERGGRARDDGHNRRNGAKIHLAVATLGHLLAVVVTPANAHDRAQVATLAQRMQELPGDTGAVAVGDQGYTGAQPAAEAAAHGASPIQAGFGSRSEEHPLLLLFLLALRQTPVERQQAGTIVADEFQVLDDLLGALLLFNLLIDEPLKHAEGRIIIFLRSKGIDGMNRGSDPLLMCQRVLEHVERRCEFVLRLINSAEDHAPTAVVHIVEEAQRMSALLLALQPKPVGKPGQRHRLEVGGHCHVGMGRGKFIGDLPVDRLLYALAEHRDTPFRYSMAALYQVPPEPQEDGRQQTACRSPLAPTYPTYLAAATVPKQTDALCISVA